MPSQAKTSTQCHGDGLERFSCTGVNAAAGWLAAGHQDGRPAGQPARTDRCPDRREDRRRQGEEKDIHDIADLIDSCATRRQCRPLVSFAYPGLGAKLSQPRERASWIGTREAGWAACSAVGPAPGRTDTHLSSLSGIARHRQSWRGSGPGCLRPPRLRSSRVQFVDEAHGGDAAAARRRPREQRKSGERQAKKAKEIGTGRAGGLSWRRVGRFVRFVWVGPPTLPWHPGLLARLLGSSPPTAINWWNP